MAAGNTNYVGINAGTVAAGLAYAVEGIVKKEWEYEYVQKHPLMDGLWNRAEHAAITGPKMLIPVAIQKSASWTQITRTQESNTITAGQGDGTMAEAPWTKFVARQQFTHTELIELANYAEKRGSLPKLRAAELQEEFKNAWLTEFYGNQNAAENHLCGLPYMLATSNLVHNIDQSDANNANFRANVTTSTGLLTLTLLDSNIEKLIREKNSKPDLIVIAALASGGTVDLYTRLKQVLENQVMLTASVGSGDMDRRYGPNSFMFRGCNVICDHFAPNGEVYVLDTSSFVLCGDKAPQSVIQGEYINSTEAYENVFQVRSQVMIKAPRKNWRYTGVTG